MQEEGKGIVELRHLVEPYSENWKSRFESFFEGLFGAPGGFFPMQAQKAVVLRAPDIKPDKGVPFGALIHPSNPESGPYGGMSFVVFPVAEGPPMIGLVIGTLGLSPDEEVLSRPGHGRRVRALCSCLNKRYSKDGGVAWSKEDPVRIDREVPDNVVRQLPAYGPIFKRYGKVIYGFFIPPEGLSDEELREVFLAFLGLYFAEYGHRPLAAFAQRLEAVESHCLAGLMPDLSEDDLFSLLLERHFAVLTGPPGTGKTHLALQMLKNRFDDKGRVVQFHPNVTYEQFLGGLFPEKSGDSQLGFRFAPRPGILLEAVKEAKTSQKPYLLVIDEINRADLSRVLGEAIFLFESGDFSRSLDLPYDFGEAFGGSRLSMPENLYVLGTMNSADRSIAIMDIAIRRRFAFAKLWPQFDVVVRQGCPLMEKAFKSLVQIFVENAGEDAFPLIPGHSYFMESDETRAPDRLRRNLIPLLEEYLHQGYISGFSGPVLAYIQWVMSL